MGFFSIVIVVEDKENILVMGFWLVIEEKNLFLSQIEWLLVENGLVLDVIQYLFNVFLCFVVVDGGINFMFIMVELVEFRFCCQLELIFLLEMVV